MNQDLNETTGVDEHPSFSPDGRVPGCDAESPTTYFFEGEWRCRCIVCARCGKHTGNSNQGHYWSYCKVTEKNEAFHFCCLNDCELRADIMETDV